MEQGWGCSDTFQVRASLGRQVDHKLLSRVSTLRFHCRRRPGKERVQLSRGHRQLGPAAHGAEHAEEGPARGQGRGAPVPGRRPRALSCFFHRAFISAPPPAAAAAAFQRASRPRHQYQQFQFSCSPGSRPGHAGPPQGEGAGRRKGLEAGLGTGRPVPGSPAKVPPGAPAHPGSDSWVGPQGWLKKGPTCTCPSASGG